MKKNLLLSILLSGSVVMSQLGIETMTPNSDSILDALSTNKGVLLPRVALSSTNLASSLCAFVAGIVVYNAATAGSGSNIVFPAIYCSDGFTWISFKVNDIGDVKNGFQATDHEGWCLLDGRILTTLSAIANKSTML
ncbi:hypothetical protein [Flavobacterium sp.]|uniref:hypothetical protein n=1 Tax=Flavobacterium sp. TaxID=239 RepID=UPI0038FC2CC0